MRVPRLLFLEASVESNLKLVFECDLTHAGGYHQMAASNSGKSGGALPQRGYETQPANAPHILAPPIVSQMGGQWSGAPIGTDPVNPAYVAPYGAPGASYRAPYGGPPDGAPPRTSNFDSDYAPLGFSPPQPPPSGIWAARPTAMWPPPVQWSAGTAGGMLEPDERAMQQMLLSLQQQNHQLQVGLEAKRAKRLQQQQQQQQQQLSAAVQAPSPPKAEAPTWKRPWRYGDDAVTPDPAPLSAVEQMLTDTADAQRQLMMKLGSATAVGSAGRAHPVSRRTYASAPTTENQSTTKPGLRASLQTPPTASKPAGAAPNATPVPKQLESEPKKPKPAEQPKVTEKPKPKQRSWKLADLDLDKWTGDDDDEPEEEAESEEPLDDWQIEQKEQEKKEATAQRQKLLGPLGRFRAGVHALRYLIALWRLSQRGSIPKVGLHPYSTPHLLPPPAHIPSMAYLARPCSAKIPPLRDGIVYLPDQRGRPERSLDFGRTFCAGGAGGAARGEHSCHYSVGRAADCATHLVPPRRIIGRRSG
eukprot:SAG11_NODE_2610_length_3173_cov_2.271308_4_plen_531_part_00